MGASVDSAVEQSDNGMRLLTAVLAVALLVAVVGLTLNSLDIADGPLCSDKRAIAQEAGGGASVECFEGSAERRVATVASGFAAAVLALLAAAAAIWMAASGRASRYLMPLTGAALLLGGASILIANL